MTSLFASFITGDSQLSVGRLFGMALGLGGLAVIFSEGYNLQPGTWKGVCGVLLSVLVHSLGAVLLKQQKPDMPPVSVTAGSLSIATPLFGLNVLLSGNWPESVPMQSLAAIVYLGLMGSALGFPLYFFLLSRLSAERVALITLMTPVLALLLGTVLNGETVGLRVWSGTGLIVAGLAYYEYGRYLPSPAAWRTRWKQTPL